MLGMVKKNDRKKDESIVIITSAQRGQVEVVTVGAAVDAVVVVLVAIVTTSVRHGVDNGAITRRSIHRYRS
jgi:hypothetical protein